MRISFSQSGLALRLAQKRQVNPENPIRKYLFSPLETIENSVEEINRELNKKVAAAKLLKEQEREPYGLVSADNLIQQRKLDSYSGDFTDAGIDFYTGHVGDVSLEQALKKSTTINMDDPSSQLSWTERLEDFRQNGLSKEISWSEVGQDFSTLSYVNMTDWETDPEKVMDYYASKYVALKAQIARDFTGDDLQENLSQLEKILEQNTEAYAKNLAEKLGGFYENAGMSGEKDKIYLSVVKSIQDKAVYYENYATTNPNYVKIEDERDQWLYRCSDYTASQLRKEAKQTEEIYSNDELYREGTIQSLFDFAMSGIHLTRSTMGRKDDGDTSVRVGVMMLEFQVISENSRVSEEHKNALRHVLQSKISDEVRNQTAASQGIHAVLETYENTKDIRQSIAALLEAGKSYGSVPSFGLVTQSMRNMFERIGLDDERRLDQTGKSNSPISELSGRNLDVLI